MNKTSMRRAFIFPGSRRYPVDEVCEEIVRALCKCRFRARGLKVEVMRPASENVAYVTRIQGANFEIEFETREFDGTQAATRIHIPGRELRLGNCEQHIFLHVCEDDPEVASGEKNHGPNSLCVYKGSEGGARIEPLTPKQQVPIFLVATDDSRWLELGRPANLLTRDVLLQFRCWLKENVLAHIESSS